MLRLCRSQRFKIQVQVQVSPYAEEAVRVSEVSGSGSSKALCCVLSGLSGTPLRGKESEVRRWAERGVRVCLRGVGLRRQGSQFKAKARSQGVWSQFQVRR
jgi:hypothetical protein